MLFKLADCGKAVYCVTGETAHTLCDDQVDFSGKRIFYHLVETFTVTSTRPGDSFIGIDLNKLPSRIALDELCVVIGLSLKAGELLVLICGDAGISRNLAFFYFVLDPASCGIDSCRYYCHISSCCHTRLPPDFSLRSVARILSFPPSTIPTGTGLPIYGCIHAHPENERQADYHYLR